MCICPADALSKIETFISRYLKFEGHAVDVFPSTVQYLALHHLWLVLQIRPVHLLEQFAAVRSEDKQVRKC